MCTDDVDVAMVRGALITAVATPIIAYLAAMNVGDNPFFDIHLLYGLITIWIIFVLSFIFCYKMSDAIDVFLSKVTKNE